MAELLSHTDALYILSAWFSPSYPVGAFSYSHGLEYAVETELVNDRQTAQNYITDALNFGAGQLDANVLKAAYHAAIACEHKQLAELSETAAAFVGTKELALESHAQAAAFLKITSDCWPATALAAFRTSCPEPHAYSVVVGVAAAAHNLPLAATLTAYLHGFSANLISAAVRLVPLGQTDGQKITAALREQVANLVEQTLKCDRPQLSSSALNIDWCSMKHEDQYTRLFRS